MNLKSFLEALIFASPEPIDLEQLHKVWEELNPDSKLNQLSMVQEIGRMKIEFQNSGFQLIEVGGGYKFVTNPDYHDAIGLLLKNNSKRRLSPAALESLALIAYQQPVTKGDLEYIRGVNCDSAVHKLLERELIRIVGKGDGPGKPILYGTTPFFMEYFGINDLSELPKMEDIKSDINEVGTEKE